MIRQTTLGKIHRLLGWLMLVLLPVQLFSGLGAMGKMAAGGSEVAGAIHVGPWASLGLGVMIISHGLLGIRFTVMKKLGPRPGALLLAAVWAAFLFLLMIITL